MEHCVQIEGAPELTYWVNLLPFVVLRLEIQRHHVTTHRRHFEGHPDPAPSRREDSLEFVNVARTAVGLAPSALLLREDLCQRASQRGLLRYHQNHNHTFLTRLPVAATREYRVFFARNASIVPEGQRSLKE